MRAAMEAEVKALGERIVADTNPPLKYDQVRTLASNLLLFQSLSITRSR
jgi:hypothetical protein